MLKWYYIEKLKNEEQYVEFIEYMLKNSDFFSVVYFRYNERESLRRSVKQIRDELRKYKIYSKNTKEWPGTVVMNETHVYRIAYYRSDINVWKHLYVSEDYLTGIIRMLQGIYAFTKIIIVVC